MKRILKQLIVWCTVEPSLDDLKRQLGTRKRYHILAVEPLSYVAKAWRVGEAGFPVYGYGWTPNRALRDAIERLEMSESHDSR